MSLTPRLTMLATVRRFTASGADPDGHATGTWNTSEIPCWLFHPGPTEESHGEAVNALVDLGADPFRFGADLVTRGLPLAKLPREQLRRAEVGEDGRDPRHLFACFARCRRPKAR